MATDRVGAAAAAMRQAAAAFDAAYRAGADESTLAPLRAVHQSMRAAWFRARAAAGDPQAAIMVAIGAAD